MTTNSSPQVRMANDIAAQFPHLPRDTAVTMIATHIRQFWDPRMRADLLHQAETDSDSLDPLALAATRLIQAPSHASD